MQYDHSKERDGSGGVVVDVNKGMQCHRWGQGRVQHHTPSGGSSSNLRRERGREREEGRGRRRERKRRERKRERRGEEEREEGKGEVHSLID